MGLSTTGAPASHPDASAITAAEPVPRRRRIARNRSTARGAPPRRCNHKVAGWAGRSSGFAAGTGIGVPHAAERVPAAGEECDQRF